ncbi:MAG: serine/threonine-protein kinase [Pirellulales bacterium]
MEPHLRFEILQQIAAGDYATVYRARDRELGREVAIKQIHPQFLQDPRQLDRYWQEAQLLASLEHPHIMMIYDIVRDRGWLVLELMQGSLQSLLAGRPIDLNDLRMALTYTLHALQFMHEHGIVHGDVKPSNLLVDRNHRVKLGDFGIARRVKGDHGSVVKGTTRYMAPEVVSDQFGPVGPHSDLYSLGFSAFELMCGENFDSLFPGLHMFGRDQQVAWMMWHSASDRRLPEIERVLQGVPRDLAYVIQRMTEKDPARRYRTAAEVLEDLKRGTTAETALTREQEEAAALAARQAKRRRRLSIGAFVASTVLSLSVAFWPEKAPPPAPPPAIVKPIDGIIGDIDLERGIFFLRAVEEGDTPQGVQVDGERDRVYLNDQRVSLGELRADDTVALKYLTSDGVEFKEIYATRPQTSETAGIVESVDVATATLRLTAGEGDMSAEPWYVPDGTSIQLNGDTKLDSRPVKLADLQPRDQITVTHVKSDEGRIVVRSIIALRTLTVAGAVLTRNPQQARLTIETPGAGGVPTKRAFTVAPRVTVTINGRELAGDVPLTIADLNPGDRVTLTHDAIVHKIEAARDVSASGPIVDIQPSVRTFKVQVAGSAKPLDFALAPNCSIVGTANEPIEFDFLRRGDQVDVDYEPLNPAQLQAIRILARPASDPRTWAIVVGQSSYDDARLTALPQAAAAANAVATALRDRYRVPAEQLLVIKDGSRLQLEQGLGSFLPKVPAEAQLICYYVGHGVVDPAAGPLLTPKEFDAQRAGETGWSLRALVKLLEKCPAQERVLLLDSCHAGSDPQWEPSAAEQAEAVKEKPTRPVSTHVLVIAGCSRGERGLAGRDGAPDVFGSVVAQAFALEADANRDGRVVVAELLEFLPRGLNKAAEGKQSVAVFQPDARPPRLSEPAREAVTKMLRYLRASRFDDAMATDYQTSQGLAPKEPDLPLAFGLVLLRHSRLPLARPILERVRLEHPKSPVAHQAVAWQDFLQGRLGEGVAALQQMVVNLPDTTLEPDADPYFRYALQFAGALREYSLSAPETPLTRTDVDGLDRAVIARGEAAKEAYRKGVESARESLAKIDRELSEATSDRRPALLVDRRRPTYYTTFNYTLIADFLRHRLDE